ncbi:MAG TPA: HAMP domain-containing histidine kinase [Candidatus Pullilachnospira intestinigallinarum]|nr:HAMP domain-containing histidine kinase [Candidatus Pullilachnospira intestinigallinarum]
MKTVPKLIRRFVETLIVSSVVLVVVNIVLFLFMVTRFEPNAHPYSSAENVAAALTKQEDGYRLSKEGAGILAETGAWAILIADGSGQVVWSQGPLPEGIPQTYSLAQVASLTRGYLEDCPTYPAAAEGGLLVLGFPAGSYWKHQWPSWNVELIASVPRILLTWIICNILVIFLIYLAANGKIVKSVGPLVSGIQALARGEQVHVPERGLLSEIAASVNRTSDILLSKNREIRRKDLARANWIAGVSHDIRTPLSMVMGYAAGMEKEEGLPEKFRRQAAAIRRQSQRMKNLINDLNLASKMEYNMQQVKTEPVNAVALLRRAVVDFINTDPEEKYPVEWETPDALSVCRIMGDPDLLSRAIFNLIQNCVNHNEQGCTIYAGVEEKEGNCRIRIDDDGVGATREELERLAGVPHYMVCDQNTREQRHGLGLLIVRQIARAHQGSVEIGASVHGGFSVTIVLPLGLS